MSARDVLAKPTGNTNAQSFDTYFAGNRGAKKFVEEWLAMRAAGESDWSAARVLRYLREHKNCRMRADSSFRAWLHENHPKHYRAGGRG